jgi:hypothetical protein
MSCVIWIFFLVIFLIHLGYSASVMPMQQHAINTPETVIFSSEEMLVEAGFSKRTIQRTSTAAIPAKKRERKTSFVSLKSIS